MILGAFQVAGRNAQVAGDDMHGLMLAVDGSWLAR